MQSCSNCAVIFSFGFQPATSSDFVHAHSIMLKMYRQMCDLRFFPDSHIFSFSAGCASPWFIHCTFLPTLKDCHMYILGQYFFVCPKSSKQGISVHCAMEHAQCTEIRLLRDTPNPPFTRFTDLPVLPKSNCCITAPEHLSYY